MDDLKDLESQLAGMKIEGEDDEDDDNEGFEDEEPEVKPKKEETKKANKK